MLTYVRQVVAAHETGSTLPLAGPTKLIIGAVIVGRIRLAAASAFTTHNVLLCERARVQITQTNQPLLDSLGIRRRKVRDFMYMAFSV